MENIIICTHNEQLIPEKKTPEAMCRDIKTSETFTLQPGELKLVKSWIKTFIPIGRCCKMYARSSLPIKNGLILANSVGLFDSDYRGEYLMQIMNMTKEPITIEQYTRLCQLEFCPHHWGKNNFGTNEVPAIEIKVDDQLFESFAESYPSERGAWWLGSTGKI